MPDASPVLPLVCREMTDVYIHVGARGRCPQRASDGAAGYDLYLAEDLVLAPGQTCLVPLDIRIALEPGIEAQIRPRSGLSLRTALRLANTPGTIDSDYRGELAVLFSNVYSQADLASQIWRQPGLLDTLREQGRARTLGELLPERIEELKQFNLADQHLYFDEQGDLWGTLRFRAGERVAQLVLARPMDARFILHDHPERIGSDRGGGFGSSGL